MALYTYKGLTQPEKEALVKAHTAKLVPPEKRGQPAMYRIDKEDEEEVKEQKRARKAKWFKDREKEALAEVEKRDASMTLIDTENADKPVVFEKGKAVEVADGTLLAKKLDSLCGVGRPASKLRRAWEKAEEKKKG